MKLIIDIDEDSYRECKFRKDLLSLGGEPTDLTFNMRMETTIANGTPLEDIVEGIKSHKWGNNEGSKEIYNNAIDDVLTYIEEKLGE